MTNTCVSRQTRVCRDKTFALEPGAVRLNVALPFMPTDTVRTITVRDGKLRAATFTLTQLVN